MGVRRVCGGIVIPHLASSYTATSASAAPNTQPVTLEDNNSVFTHSTAAAAAVTVTQRHIRGHQLLTDNNVSYALFIYLLFITNKWGA